MPRNRPPAAAISPASTASTLGSRKSAKLTMPAQILVLPPRRSPSSAIARANLAFADRPHFLGTAGAITRTALDEHGRNDVVPRIDVRPRARRGDSGCPGDPRDDDAGRRSADQ